MGPPSAEVAAGLGSQVVASPGIPVARPSEVAAEGLAVSAVAAVAAAARRWGETLRGAMGAVTRVVDAAGGRGPTGGVAVADDQPLRPFVARAGRETPLRRTARLPQRLPLL